MAIAERVMCKDMEKAQKSKHLFKICMEGKWNEVVDIYKEDKRAHTARITRSEDTALHVAVADGQVDVVAQLVEVVQQQTPQALRIQNKRRNTACHFAASMGTKKMIEDIATADPSLVSMRNVDGETPLFLAALHGRKEAFMTLHYICYKEPGTAITYSNCRRNDGDTILHCAIAADNFDLAFQIIHLYGGLVNWVNQMGASPLHLLATKPSAFRSGCRLGRFETFTYYGIWVKELKVDPSYQQPSEMTGKDKNSFPENYQTCVDLMSVMKNAASVVTNKFPVANYLIGKFARKDQTRTKTGDPEALENTAANGVKTNSPGSEAKAWPHPLFPENYKCCADFLKFVLLVIVVIFGRGTTIFTKMRRKKEKHVWSVQIMNELLKRTSMYEFDGNGSSGPQPDLGDSKAQDQETIPYSVYEGGSDTSESDCISEKQEPSTTKGKAHQQNNKKGDKKYKRSKRRKEMETPILIAAKNGVTEMVEKILEMFPVAVHDMDANKKNIVLLAVENRQPHLYQLLLKKKAQKESLFRKVDDKANSALHLAAKLGDYKPWLITGAALQMYWENKWYLFVKESMPPRFFGRYNKRGKSPREIFINTHKKLVKGGGEWLKQTSESCSVVAALIATVAFATSTTVPGGVHEQTGIPTLENTTAFKVFAISSLIALACSVSAVVLFLSILTSRYQEYDFGNSLPRKLILGLTSLFMSITSMLVSFCAGHFLVLRNKLRDAALPIYAVTCLPVTLFALAQLPLYIDLIWATFKKVPQRSYKATRL